MNISFNGFIAISSKDGPPSNKTKKLHFFNTNNNNFAVYDGKFRVYGENLGQTEFTLPPDMNNQFIADSLDKASMTDGITKMNFIA